jgi:hypothetical protein
MALDSYFSNTIAPGGQATTSTTRSVFPAYGTALQDPNAMVQDAMGAALDPNSSYIQNARRRGLETAATRGGINSSIAAGASERAAIEAAMPLAQQSLNIQQAREAVQSEEWLTQQNFNRAMMGQYQQAAFQNTLGMLQSIQQYALEDPELYTPDVVSGYSDFFSQNMNNIVSRYFGNQG